MLRFGIKPGLHRIQYLLDQLGRPQLCFPSVHVAGTNGKGSVTAIISQVLTEAGYTVGRFVSPHLDSYRERFTVNNTWISPHEMGVLLEEMQPAVEACAKTGETATEFEILTALAFLYFARRQVDIAVVEAGLGGLLDSTNVLNPIVSVITNVSYDHMAYLGDTLPEIARSKAGIAKPGVSLVCGEPEEDTVTVLQDESIRRGAVFQRAGELITLDTYQDIGSAGSRISFNGRSIRGSNMNFGLRGVYQRENLVTALAALDSISETFPVTESALERGLANVRWPGRMELISDNPRIVLDCAHNPAGARAAAQSLAMLFPNQKRVMVIGILDDKDGEEIIRQLAEETRLCIVTRPVSDRAQNWQERAAQAGRCISDVQVVEGIEEAVKQAAATAGKDEYILITGSFYVLETARRFLNNTPTQS